MKINMMTAVSETPVEVFIEKIVGRLVFVRSRGIFELDALGRLSRTIELNGQELTEMLLRPDLETNIWFGSTGLEILTKLFYTFELGEPVHWDIAGSYITGRVVQMKGKRVQVQEDKLVKDTSNGQFSIQPDPQGRIHAFSLRKSGVWRMAHITDHKSSLYRGCFYE